MSVDEQIQSVAARLRELKRLDTTKAVFGAGKHHYALNPVKDAAELEHFEAEHGIRLPEGYRQFLLKLGNGGAGPYYGLQRLEQSLWVDLDFKTGQLDPSRPFPITEMWNPEYVGDPNDDKALADFEEEYFDDRWITGLLRICNFGCGVSMNLVVNGPEYGHIWVDDRGNDGGLYPDPYFEHEGRTRFLTWYALWLDQSLETVQG